MFDVTHVILDTRPSSFSACNIEKLGRAWGRGYTNVVAGFSLYNSSTKFENVCTKLVMCGHFVRTLLNPYFKLCKYSMYKSINAYRL